MANGTLTISGTQTGLASGGSRVFLQSIPFSSVEDSIPITLASGDNTITVPPGCTGFELVPSTAANLTLKGVTGDTGIPLSKTLPTYISLGTLPASFIITASAANGSIQVRFF